MTPIDDDDLCMMEVRANAIGPTSISWKSPRAASDILDLITALRAERARTERLVGLLREAWEHVPMLTRDGDEVELWRRIDAELAKGGE